MIKIVAVISSLLSLIPLITGLIFYKSFRSNSSKVFICFIFITALTEILNLALGLMKLNNLWLNNVYLFIPLITFQLILYLERNLINLKISFILNIILALLYFLGIFNLETLFIFNHINSIFSSFVTSLLCLILFYEIINFPNSKKSTFLFTITSATLFYSATTLVIYGLFNTFNVSKDKLLFLYTIPQTIVNIVTNIIYAKAMYGSNNK